MEIRTKVLLGLGVAAGLMTFGVVASRVLERADSSSLARHARGWSLAREYLAERGLDPRIGRDAVPVRDDREVLVLAFPWQVRAGQQAIEAIRHWVTSGGVVMIGYSGDRWAREDELRVLESLGLDLVEVRSAAPLHPRAWWQYSTEQWELTGPTPLRPPNSVVVEAVANAPVPPPESEILLERKGSGQPLAFRSAYGAGELILVPASLLSNSMLSTPGNLGLLEALGRAYPGGWLFDEFHHGAGQKSDADLSKTAGIGPWDLFVGHLILVYVLAVVRLSRPFGPLPTASSSVPTTPASSRAYLLGLGALHRRLGHHRRAAELLDIRLAALDGHSADDAALASTYEASLSDLTVTGDRSLLEAARAVERRRLNRSKTSFPRTTE